MLIHVKGSAFWAEAAYEERTALKAAGFWWHGEACRPGCGACAAGIRRKVWWTPKSEIATALIACADDAAREALAPTAARQELSRADDATIEIEAPAGLSYRGYQRAGVAFALDAFARGQKGVLIGDEMGLGKTMQGIGCFVALGRPRTLVVAPVSLLANWKREIEKWAPGTRVQVVKGREALDADADVVVINYDKVAGTHGRATAKALLAERFGLVIFDEAQALKNEKSQRTKVFFGEYGRGGEIKSEGVAHRAERVLVLTGTPVPNRIVELLSILRAIGAFSGENAIARHAGGFLFRYCGPEDVWTGRTYVKQFNGATNLPELQARLRNGWMVRRLKADVATELPPKIRQLVLVNGELSERAREIEGAIRDFAAEMDAATPDTFEAAIAAMRGERAAFEAISRVRAELAELKIAPTLNHVDDLLESTGKVIVFAHHQVLVKALAAHYGDAAIVIDGSTPPADRLGLVDRFQADPACRVAVLSTHAAGVGLTLTAASVVVFAEADWTPSWLVQAEDRAHRIGQTADAVHVQYLAFDGTLDARVLGLAIAKLDVADRALDRVTDVGEVTKGAPEPKAPKAPAAAPKAPATVRTVATKGEEVEVSDEKIAAVHEALRILAERCDGALDKDGAGFNKMDTAFGCRLAESPTLSDRQAAAAIKMVRKYRGQLPAELCAALGFRVA